MKKNKIIDFRFHDLRHTFASDKFETKGLFWAVIFFVSGMKNDIK